MPRVGIKNGACCYSLDANHYPEGGNPANPSEVFINHGSSLRRNGDAWFSSLSKLNVIAKPEGQTLNLTVGGQPKINMRYRTSLPNVTLNGNPVKPVRNGNMVKVKGVD